MKEKFLALLAQYNIDLDSLVLIVIGILVVLLIFCLIAHLAKIAIGIAVIVFVIPMLFTLYFGDGSNIVNKVTDYLDPTVGQQVEESYKHFKDKEKENPVLDIDAINKAAEQAKEQAKDKIKDWLN